MYEYNGAVVVIIYSVYVLLWIRWVVWWWYHYGRERGCVRKMRRGER
jgi:hypothetical protein